jgi:hypothetical protein
VNRRSSLEVERMEGEGEREAADIEDTFERGAGSSSRSWTPSRSTAASNADAF